MNMITICWFIIGIGVFISLGKHKKQEVLNLVDELTGFYNKSVVALLLTVTSLIAVAVWPLMIYYYIKKLIKK